MTFQQLLYAFVQGQILPRKNERVWGCDNSGGSAEKRVKTAALASKIRVESNTNVNRVPAAYIARPIAHIANPGPVALLHPARHDGALRPTCQQDRHCRVLALALHMFSGQEKRHGSALPHGV
jgi:hypothetical protein